MFHPSFLPTEILNGNVRGLCQNKACCTCVTHYKEAVSRHLKGTPVARKCFIKSMQIKPTLKFLQRGLSWYTKSSFCHLQLRTARVEKGWKNGLVFSSLEAMYHQNAVNTVNREKKAYCRACRAFLLMLFPFGRLPLSALEKMKNMKKCWQYIAVSTVNKVNYQVWDSWT